jgi:hypothetical protein
VFIEKIGLSNKSVVKNIVGKTGRESMLPSDIEKLITYARDNCPDVLDK